MSSLLIEKGLIGGQITATDRLNNYPGFPEGMAALSLPS